jgi:NAD(P)-dependent dehydrogenase (short-subunit alcohol dehydrogenase family)
MARYVETHINPTGPGDARPTALQIIADEGVEGKLKDKIIVITGTSSGIGIETVRALSATGARLFLIARDLDKAKSALDGIYDPTRMELIQMDQSSLASVREGAKRILTKTDEINILVNNAGIMAVQTLEFTEDGHELQFGVNHLSHFLLFELLKPALLAAVTPGFHSRVVMVSSAAHLRNGINESDNYNFQKGGYVPLVSYSQSKTANIYMANEIERRYGSQGLHATSLHPGGIWTPLTRYLPDSEIQDVQNNKEMLRYMKSPEQGAATSVWAAIGKEWEGRGGKYLTNCAEAKSAGPEIDFTDFDYAKYAEYAYDPEKESRLWNNSMKLVGLN